MHVAKTQDEAMRHLRNMHELIVNVHKSLPPVWFTEAERQLIKDAELFLKFGAMSDEVKNASKTSPDNKPV